jgi:ferredoxin
MSRTMARPDAWAPSPGSPTGSAGRAGTRAAARPNAWALDVDRIRCDGYGMCAELLPELIALDDWGYPIVRPGGVPEDLRGLAGRAVDVCPVLALRLRRVLPRS